MRVGAGVEQCRAEVGPTLVGSSGGDDRIANACSNCSRSERAPAVTIRSSSASSPVSATASSLRACPSPRSGRPTPRSQSAIIAGRPDRPAHPLARTYPGDALEPNLRCSVARYRPPHAPPRSGRPGCSGAGVCKSKAVSSSSSLPAMTRWRATEIGSRLVQCHQLPAYIRRQFSGFDIGRRLLQPSFPRLGVIAGFDRTGAARAVLAGRTACWIPALLIVGR